MSRARRGKDKKDSHTPSGVLASIFDEILEKDNLTGLVKTRIDQTAERLKLTGTTKPRFKSNLSTHMNSSRMTIKTFIILLKDVLLIETLTLTIAVTYMNDKVSRYEKKMQLNIAPTNVKEKPKTESDNSAKKRSTTPEGVLAELFKEIRIKDGFDRTMVTAMDASADKLGYTGTQRSKYKSNIKTHLASKKMSIKIFMSLLKDILVVKDLDLVFTLKYGNGKVSSYDKVIPLNLPNKEKEVGENSEQ